MAGCLRVEAFLKLSGEIIKISAGAHAILAGPSLAMLPSYVAKEAHTLLKGCVTSEQEQTKTVSNDRTVAVQNTSQVEDTATSAAGLSSANPLQKIWALLHDPRKCSDVIWLAEYIEENLCIDTAEELADYLEADDIIEELKEYLHQGPRKIFEINVDKLKIMLN